MALKPRADGYRSPIQGQTKGLMLYNFFSKNVRKMCDYSPNTINAHARTCQPRANADESYYGNEEHPEPEEHVDLLVVPMQ